jgi:hypothetical protein
MGGFDNINGVYNCVIHGRQIGLYSCKNIIGCRFVVGENEAVNITKCDTIVLDTASKELFDNNPNCNITDCTNVIFDGAFVTPSDFENAIGDINAVLDELHNYAQALISGGVSE